MTDKLQHFTFKEDIIVERFDERALLVDMDTEKIFELNATGARIAELIIEKCSISEIITTINREFEATLQEKELDVLEFMQELLANGLITENLNRNGNRG